MVIDNGCAVIRENASSDVEPAYDVISGEIGHGRSTTTFEGHCFDPLNIAFGGSNNPYAASRW